MGNNYRKIGDFIKPVKVKNRELKYSELLGINIEKFFMPSVANVVGTDLTNYKIVKPGQFACNRMHVGRDYRIPVALSREKDPFIVSPAYDVFEIARPNELDADYLMMWFSRKEYDRNAWFYTDADVRGGLSWDAFSGIGIPVPPIEKQREIVAEYQAVQKRIHINEQLIQKLEETAQAVYRRWFVEFEFPDENGNPYKSSGGKMVWCEELGKEVPEGWETKYLNDISDIKTGPFGSALLNEQYITGGIPVITVEHIKDFKISNLKYPSVTEDDAKRLKAYALLEGDIIFSRVGSVDLSALVKQENEGWLFSSRMIRVRPIIKQIHPILLSNFLRFPETRKLIVSLSVGSTMPSINTEILAGIPICLMPINIGEKISDVFINIDNLISIHYLEKQKLMKLKELLFSKLATIEN